jgi:hypothetical protein
MMILDSSPPGIRDRRLRGARGAIRKPFANTLCLTSVRSAQAASDHRVRASHCISMIADMQCPV